MKTARVFIVVISAVTFLLLQLDTTETAPQENTFELPIQLVGFPVIILAVRISTFLRKLAYSLNPNTYASRSRRSFEGMGSPINITEVEAKLVHEMGPNFCIYGDLCEKYAEAALRNATDQKEILTWNRVVREYKDSSPERRENHLLSIFLGDIVKSPELCRQLVKKGRNCK